MAGIDKSPIDEAVRMALDNAEPTEISARTGLSEDAVREAFRLASYKTDDPMDEVWLRKMARGHETSDNQ